MIQLLIRSRRTLAAELLAISISSHPDLALVQVAENDEELLKAFESRGVHVVLIITDRAEGDRWLDTLKRIRDAAPRTRVILLSEEREPDLVVAAFAAGIRGFFSLRGSTLEKLYRCIEQVHGGQIWANSEELEWVLQALERANPASKPLSVVNAFGQRLLSGREEDVVKLLREGLQNRDIAHALNLSEHTIKNYLFRIYDKLGVSSRTELLLYVMTPRSAQMRNVSRGAE